MAQENVNSSHSGYGMICCNRPIWPFRFVPLGSLSPPDLSRAVQITD